MKNSSTFASTDPTKERQAPQNVTLEIILKALALAFLAIVVIGVFKKHHIDLREPLLWFFVVSVVINLVMFWRRRGRWKL